MMRKILLSLMVSLGFWGGLHASHDYIIPTNDPNISCKVTVLSKMETKDLLDLTLDAVTYSGVGNSNITVQMGPLKQLHERFMTVQVSLINNSLKTITLKKDDYFDLMYKDKAFVPKRDILKFYPCGRNAMIFSGIAIPVLIGLLAFVNAGSRKVDTGLIAANFGFGILMIACVIAIINGISYENKFASVYSKLRPKPDHVDNVFEIPAGGRFSDVFFLDLDLVALNFFETNQVKLEYGVKD